jgi:hypothetical protein
MVSSGGSSVRQQIGKEDRNDKCSQHHRCPDGLERSKKRFGIEA